MSQGSHKADAPAITRCFVLTISDTRTAETDTSGRAIADLLAGAGHQMTGRAIVKDDPAAVKAIVEEEIANPDTQVIITTGGTGITSRDSTYEAIGGLFDKRLEGFGELFRFLSYDEIGSAAMLTRACAGAAGGTVIFSLPGAENAVRLGMMKLILPELGHLVREVAR